ncbi:unnamed protein product [Diplocarpon coronariae]
MSSTHANRAEIVPSAPEATRLHMLRLRSLHPWVSCAPEPTTSTPPPPSSDSKLTASPDAASRRITSQSNIPQRSLHPHLRIQPMQEFDVGRHRLRSRRPRSLEEHALQPELRHALLALDLNAHLEQAVGVPHRLHQRRVPAPHDDRGRRFGDHLEVVRDFCAGLVRRRQEGRAIPQLMGRGGGVSVFFLQIPALVCVAYGPTPISP